MRNNIIILAIFIILCIFIYSNYKTKYEYSVEEAENKCILLSSRGILKSCDIISNNPVSSIKKLKNYKNLYNRLESIEYGTTIYVCSSALRDFLENYFPIISNKFILVSGDCDETFPYDILTKEEFNKLVNSDKLIHWFVQNCVIAHPKITGIPIGLDYHTMSMYDHEWGKHKSPLKQERILLNLTKQSKPFYDRIIKIYSNCHFAIKSAKYGYDRQDAIDNIPKDLVYYEPNKINRMDSWKKQTNFAFVLSPHGNGLDCHRTWEALCLGCIPIVKTSNIDYLYKDLPVLIVEDWSDVTFNLLNNTILSFQNKRFNFNRLTLKYWTDQIKSH
jgi:hypothetical protein